MCDALTQVKENDGLPSLCCVQCHSDLIISITIRRKCIYSDNIMRALLQSTFVQAGAHGCVDFDHIKQEGSDVEHLELESDELVLPPEISFEKDNYKHYKLNITSTTAQDINERMVADDGYKEFGVVYQKLQHQRYEHILKRPNNEEQTQEAKGNIQQDEHILEKSSKCCGCGSDFGTKNELLQHAQTVHAPKALVDPRKPVRCNICYKSFKTEINLHRHQNAQGPYQCAICGKIFSIPSSLYMHEIVHNTKEFECGQCGQTFHSKYARTKHIRLTHRAQASHVCPTCGKTYTTASYLREHMNLHEDKPLHKCYCGAAFKMKHYLYSHMAKAHSGRNTCRFCQATFRCPSVLKGHENGHLGIKEYFCSVCNEGFYSQKQLGKHRAKWHGPKSRIKKRKQANKSNPKLIELEKQL
ncbi:zinc finger protein 501-like [Anopheles ziemanni]|uniref:zinc finger protein 501-like n=1 Tax=Anopheles ziemanni TaxID=345580 RepID=UPI00265F4D5D|nr:zinc finger protein 501-like [Anopheles ziemanni]